MLSLAKFLPLLDRNAVVKLYENRSCIYNGMVRSIPESLWQCIVTDFDYSYHNVHKVSPERLCRL